MQEHATKNQEQPISSREGRCVNCNYDLRGLSNGACPECGRPFDWDDPTSFLSKEHFVWWAFWRPVILFCVAIILGVAIVSAGLVGDGPLGVLLGLLAIPGCLYGYCSRVTVGFFGLFGFLILITWAMTYLMGSDNSFMTMVGIGNFFFLPICLGTLAGALFRMLLKRTRFSMRIHLPAVWGVGVFLVTRLAAHGTIAGA